MHLIPHDSFSNWIENLFPTFNVQPSEMAGFFAPQVDIEEHEGGYQLIADLPGVKREDISITLEDGILTLRAERAEETKQKKLGKVIRHERRSGSYARSFSVGADVTEKDIQATFKDGVLKLNLPKPKEVVSSSHRIPVH